MYQLIKKDGLAKRGRLETVHGVIETPVFMNVGTAAAIKGAVSTDDLQNIKTQVELSNTWLCFQTILHLILSERISHCALLPSFQETDSGAGTIP